MRSQRNLNAGPAWTAERLRSWVANRYRGESMVVLANREPFRHDRAPDGDIVVNRTGGGLVTALEPLIHACSGVWVAHGAGTADRAVVDERDGIDVPLRHAQYRLRRVWLDAVEERGYCTDIPPTRSFVAVRHRCGRSSRLQGISRAQTLVGRCATRSTESPGRADITALASD